MTAEPQKHKAHKAMLVGAAGAGAVIAAPYVLPALGVGTKLMTQQIINRCTTGSGVAFGTGLSGSLNSAFAAIPGIGPQLAAGGWASTITAGIFGIGGALLGNYVHNHYDRPGRIQWGKTIKYAAIATSMLVTLPSLLSGISMGLTFLGLLAGGAALGSTVYTAMSGSLGFMGSHSLTAASSGLTGLLPHLFTCGAAGLPLVGTVFATKHSAEKQTTGNWTDRIRNAPASAPALSA